MTFPFETMQVHQLYQMLDFKEEAHGKSTREKPSPVCYAFFYRSCCWDLGCEVTAVIEQEKKRTVMDRDGIYGETFI
jgi:hypothetical protein